MTADEWNKRYPIGTPVRYSPVMPLAAGMDTIDTVTRSPAWTLGSGHHVVLVKGLPGGIHLAHLEVLSQTDPPKENP
jgi:hypothetical protein